MHCKKAAGWCQEKRSRKEVKKTNVELDPKLPHEMAQIAVWARQHALRHAGPIGQELAEHLLPCRLLSWQCSGCRRPGVPWSPIEPQSTGCSKRDISMQHTRDCVRGYYCCWRCYGCNQRCLWWSFCLLL